MIESLSLFPDGQTLDHYEDNQVEDIADLLKDPKRPRIYIILRKIDRSDAFNGFVATGITDRWLPIQEINLPKCLAGYSRKTFCDIQSQYMSKGQEMQKKGHANFQRTDSIPFETIAKLGFGAHGFVEKVRFTIDKRFYARKSIPRRLRSNVQQRKSEMKAFERELENMRKLVHDHCVELVSECAVADSDLDKILNTSNQDQDGHRTPMLRQFFGCLTSALAYLDQERIQHRDIKPANILVKDSKAYITDFGLSSDRQDLHSTTYNTYGQTTKYAAPEVIEHQKYSFEADIWSMGCVFVEM
ncbi:kinase-like protein, partial [Amniculicola lignicola CBS 123094]